MNHQLTPITIPDKAPAELVRIHETLTSLCKIPGLPHPHKQKVEPLYELMPSERYTLDLFSEATSFLGLTWETSKSIEALKQLCDIPGPVVNNLLHLVARMADGAYAVNAWNMSSGSGTLSEGTVSFNSHRELACAELEKRGWPEYDITHYSIPKAG